MLPTRQWITSGKKWMSVDRTLGYIKPGTAKKKAEAERRAANKAAVLDKYAPLLAVLAD